MLTLGSKKIDIFWYHHLFEPKGPYCVGTAGCTNLRFGKLLNYCTDNIVIIFILIIILKFQIKNCPV